MKFLKFVLFACICVAGRDASAYKIQFSSNVKYGQAYLTYYLGKNLNVVDSVPVSPAGTATFSSAKKVPGGIYAIVFGNKKFTIDFLMDSVQNISIAADTAKLNEPKITGSADNNMFRVYQKYMSDKGRKLVDERLAYNNSATAADSALHFNEYNRWNDSITQYRMSIIENKQNSLLGTLLLAMKEPPLPPGVPVTHQDSLDNYYFYKKHYWDGISFMDERVVRTPFFQPKLERYYREVLDQSQTDSIIKDIDYKLLLARTAPEMYKYLLNWLTDEFINPKYMGQDAIFVHLFDKYHSKGLTPWLNEKQMDVISRRAYMQMANLVGEGAADLDLLDMQDKPRSLYSVAAPYTLVVFWDPTCGHCKTELPKIDSIYRASWKAKGVKIYAVLNENVKKEWIDYVAREHLEDWIHVYQPKEMADAEIAAGKPGYRQLFDVTMTPTLYLLDKDKRIVAKKLSWSQINDLLLVTETNK